MKRFPTAEEIPGAASVRTMGLDDATYVLTHVRQIHEVSGMTPTMTKAVQVVHKDIEAVLRFLVEDERTQVSEVYCEGMSVDTDIPIPTRENTREFCTRIADNIHMIGWLDEITKQFLSRKYGEVFPNPEERIIRERDDLREEFRAALWGRAGDHWREEMTKDREFYDFIIKLKEKAGRDEISTHWFFEHIITRPIERHFDEAMRRVEEEGAHAHEITLDQRRAIEGVMLLNN